MDNYVQHVILLGKRLICLLILYAVSRLFFYFLNADYFSDLTVFQVLWSLLIGIRFDLAAIVFTNILLVFLILPGNYKNNTRVQQAGTILFFIVNAVALFSNIADAKYFDFIHKRSTAAVFTLLGTNRDVWLLVPQFLKDFWYVILTWIVLIVIFWIRMPRLDTQKLPAERFTVRHLLFQVILFFLVLGGMFWGARGTRLKPIGISDAAAYTDLRNVPLVLNTPFSVIKSLGNDNLIPYHYFTADSARQIYNPVRHYPAHQRTEPKNVVIIILESFSREYSGYLTGKTGYTPNLDSLLHHSLVFTHAFANGTQSYEALPAIIAGMPSLMDNPYSGSSYADNMIESLPRLLGNIGYHTAFFHGGNNGTMGFDNFVRAAGTAFYYGRDEYNHDADYDGHWGIWDEPYLQYFARQLNSFPQPFFSAVFTLSSHHPYNVPQKYQACFQEDILPILKSVRYADHALGQFFRTARQMSWYNQTLFVLTADHAAQTIERIYNSTNDMYAIPLAFYFPSDTTLAGIDGNICQQIDIMPTILDYLGHTEPFFAFGESLLDSASSRRAINFVNGIYQLIEGNFTLQFNGTTTTSFQKLNTPGAYTENDVSPGVMGSDDNLSLHTMETHIKAIIQTYNSSLINNLTHMQQN